MNKVTLLVGAVCALVSLSLPVAASETAVERDADFLKLASVSAAVSRLGESELEFDKRAQWVMPIASLTKLMTALVVLDSDAPLDAWLTINKRHYKAPANAYSRLRIGSEARRQDLLLMALMSSENLAAYLLAHHHPGGYTAFVTAMNAKARQLGMLNTRFVDAEGLSTGNVSTASDLVKLVNAAYQEPLLRQLSTNPHHTVQFREPRYSLQYVNTNPVVRGSRWPVALSKTGYLSAAGRCLVMVTEIKGEPWVVVLLDSLGTRTPVGDAGRIKRWVETGVGGTVASAASNYEREKASSLNSLEASAQTALQETLFN